MPCALNGDVIALHTWRNMHPSTPLPPPHQQQQQQLDRFARDIELAAFDEESLAVMAITEYVISHVRSSASSFSSSDVLSSQEDSKPQISYDLRT